MELQSYTDVLLHQLPPENRAEMPVDLLQGILMGVNLEFVSQIKGEVQVHTLPISEIIARVANMPPCHLVFRQNQSGQTVKIIAQPK